MVRRAVCMIGGREGDLESHAVVLLILIVIVIVIDFGSVRASIRMRIRITITMRSPAVDPLPSTCL
jgi:hypothetical protein